MGKKNKEEDDFWSGIIGLGVMCLVGYLIYNTACSDDKTEIIWDKHVNLENFNNHRWVLPDRSESYQRLKVSVTEDTGDNIEFKIFYQGRIVFDSGVYSGKREAILDIAGKNLKEHTIVVGNSNLIASKDYYFQVIVEK
tara:strand:+ start:871 stop:1287 length:417 start_codon:yes stop_codon:yes gene_type:complete